MTRLEDGTVVEDAPVLPSAPPPDPEAQAISELSVTLGDVDEIAYELSREVDDVWHVITPGAAIRKMQALLRARAEKRK